jgi:hydroxyacid-oxoacid transhydrogenase
MACCQGYPFVAGGERVFEVDAARIAYGSGAMTELAANARLLGMRRVAVFSDPGVAKLPLFGAAASALADAGCDVQQYPRVAVEPTNASFADAIAFARDVNADGYISIGGGSTIDTCKAANLYASHPAEFLAYVNAPVGEGRPVPGALRPHIACPTTAGTGSESTGIAIFDHLPLRAKTGIASWRLRPTFALIDPDWTATLPPMVVACAGFDVLAHALESYTARPYTRRGAAAPGARPLSQGANPFSDLACVEALKILGRYLVRAVSDAPDEAARERMMFAATLAGIGFGNSGVHVPHAMAYAVAGLVRDFRPRDYPGDEPIVPHGMSVILNAPAVFRFTAAADPQRHRDAASFLGARIDGAAGDGEIGEALAAHIAELMRQTGMPADLGAVGYGSGDIESLVAGTVAQQRLLANAPCPVDRDALRGLFASGLRANPANQVAVHR